MAVYMENLLEWISFIAKEMLSSFLYYLVLIKVQSFCKLVRSILSDFFLKLPCVLIAGTSRNRVNVSDVLMVYDNTSFIYLKESLNREVSDELNFAVHCTVQTANGLRSTHNRQIRLIVGDVDDNPPLFQTFQHFEKNVDRFTVIKNFFSFFSPPLFSPQCLFISQQE